MNEYCAEYGIYVDCSISGVEDHPIFAETLEDAKKQAEELGNAIEAQMQAIDPRQDYWACLEDLYLVQEDI